MHAGRGTADGGPVLRWLRRHDPGYAALRRAARTAVVMPVLFALCAGPLDQPQVATFAAFGSFALLLFADFGGPMRDRVVAQAGLVTVGAVLVVVGTLASRSPWTAVPAMGLVAFAVLFAGVVSSVLASATTAALLSFILSVMLPGDPATVPARVAGWLLAGAVSLVAVTLLWPAPARDPLRDAAATACRALAGRLRAEVASVPAGPGEAAPATEALRTRFFATPYRPTGLGAAARTVVRLADELIWLEGILDRAAPHVAHRTHRPHRPHGSRPDVDAAVAAVEERTAALLEEAAAVLETGPGTPRRPPERLRERLDAVHLARRDLERIVTGALPVLHDARTHRDEPAGPHGDGRGDDRGDDRGAEFLSSLEPTFRAQELSVVVTAIGENVAATDAALRRTWWQQLLGQQPSGVGGPWTSARARAAAHLQRHSVWLHNSLRGAVALAAAVGVADVSRVEHSFWVVLGTMAVLRSNALSIGQNAARAVLGTVVGVLVGGALVAVVGTDRAVLWALLPFAVLLAGLAPAAISFTAGQAAFSITLMVLFTIIQPSGWAVGVVRVQDVAIGGAVSLVVGAVFWPRGAAAALGDALADAYRAGADYLRAAADFGVRCCAPGRVAPPRSPDADAGRAAAAARRLDDAFREFLAERGAKHLPLGQVTVLVTGVAGLRLIADAVRGLWSGRDGAQLDRAAAGAELLVAANRVAGWYRALASSLVGAADVPLPLEHDRAADARFVDAVRRNLADPDGGASVAAVRMIWSGEHVDAARRLQGSLAAPAGTVRVVRRASRATSRATGRAGTGSPSPAR